MTVDPSTLDAILATIKKNYGPEAVGMDDPDIGLPRLSFGSLELDLITGGGIPLGRWAHLFGEKGAGKTLSAYRLIGNAQKMGYSAAYYNIEKQFDPAWAARCGIDLDKLIVLNETKVELVGAQLEALLGAINVHVIDSLPAAIPEDEAGSAPNQWHRGLHARSWGKVFRKLNDRFDSNQNCIIMINQLRSTMTTSYSGVEQLEPPCGQAPRYYASFELRFIKGKPLYRMPSGVLSDDFKYHKETLSGLTEGDGIEFQVKVEKIRYGGGNGMPNQTARLRFDFESCDFDHLFSLTKFATFYDIVEKKGSWYALPDGEKVQGEIAIRDYIQDNPEFAETIRKRVLNGSG